MRPAQPARTQVWSVSETSVIQQTRHGPATAQSLRRSFVALGVPAGRPLLVHSSLSALGWVCGGAVAVIMALEEALGPEGTLVMPTHTSQLSDPALWRRPPVPPAWIKTIRAHMPAYDPQVTPTRGMGAIPETFRTQPRVERSDHPHDSFAARGPQAGAIVAEHGLDDGLGERSPLARLYDLDGWVLLLGVSHDSNTSLHLAEYRARGGAARVRNGAPVRVEGERRWVSVSHLNYDLSDFNRIGAAFAADTGLCRHGLVADAQAMLMPQRALVDYAVAWMRRHRG